MRIRTKLIQFGMGTVIPPILLAIILGFLLVKQEQETFRRAAIEQNRAFMTTVDGEIRGHILTLRALATSKSLDTKDMPKFYAEAARVLRSQEDWRNITLASPSGQQLVNAANPADAKGISLADTQSAEAALKTGQPAIGNIRRGRMSKEYGIAVRIPVVREGSIAYLLTAILKPETFERLIKSRDLGKSWISGLVDGAGHFIARVPALSPDEMASKSYLDAVAQAREGWYRGVTVDGLESFTAYRLSEYSGWSVGLAVPISEVNAAAYSAAWLVGLGALIAIALTLSFAYLMGLQIAAPITALAAAARLIGSDNIPVQLAAHSGIREVRAVAHALAESAAAVRERQKAIDREQASLRAADRAKDEFLAMLGHELRNPLSAVRNAAALLSRPSTSDENRAAAQAIINRQTEQLTRLVDDLLEVGRVVAGKIHLEKFPVDMVEVVEAAISAIKSTGRTGTHRITAHSSGAALVLGDRSRLEQVMGNLIVNAVTYTPANGAIDVSVKREPGFVVVSVVDTGVGLRDEDQEAIFGLFYQASTSLHRSGGLGIGLTLVKRIVEMHDGKVSAHSRGLGMGTTITLRLPLLAAAPAADSKPGPVAPPSPALDILVVDDSADSRESMRLLLESEGHRVHVANDGESGVTAMLSIKPSIAIVDIGLPGMDGYQVAREIRRQLRARIALIALTGYGQPDDVRRAIDAGFDAHVVKPADIATLNALLAKLAGTSRG